MTEQKYDWLEDFNKRIVIPMREHVPPKKSKVQAQEDDYYYAKYHYSTEEFEEYLEWVEEERKLQEDREADWA